MPRHEDEEGSLLAQIMDLFGTGALDTGTRFIGAANSVRPDILLQRLSGQPDPADMLLDETRKRREDALERFMGDRPSDARAVLGSVLQDTPEALSVFGAGSLGRKGLGKAKDLFQRTGIGPQVQNAFQKLVPSPRATALEGGSLLDSLPAAFRRGPSRKPLDEIGEKITEFASRKTSTSKVVTTELRDGGKVVQNKQSKTIRYKDGDGNVVNALDRGNYIELNAMAGNGPKAFPRFMRWASAEGKPVYMKAEGGFSSSGGRAVEGLVRSGRAQPTTLPDGSRGYLLVAKSRKPKAGSLSDILGEDLAAMIEAAG